MAQYDDNNIFARIIRGEISANTVHEDEHTLAFHDVNPQTPTHVLVIPKGRYVNSDDFFNEASAEEITAFFRAVGKVARELGVAEDGYRILANTGKDAHQEVPHFHLHIFAGTDLGPMITPRG